MSGNTRWECVSPHMMEQLQATSAETQDSTPSFDVIKARMLKALADPDRESVVLSSLELDNLLQVTASGISAAKDSVEHNDLVAFYETLIEVRKRNIPIGIKNEQIHSLQNLWDMTKNIVPGRAVFEFLLIHDHPHALDGQMDRSQKYRDRLIYSAPIGPDYVKMGVTTEQSIELVYFCCVQTIETLESCRSYFGMKVKHTELFGLWGAVSYFSRYFYSNRFSQHLEIEKIYDGVVSNEDLWFEQWEVEALCNLCCPLTRPKPTPSSSQIVPVKQQPRDFTAVVNDITELVRTMNPMTPQTMTLNSDQMADLFNFITMGFEEYGLRRVVGSGNSENPQVTGLAKLEAGLDQFSEGVFLNTDEVTILGKLIKDGMGMWSENGAAYCKKNAAESDTKAKLSCALAELQSFRKWTGDAMRIVNSLASSIPALVDDSSNPDPSRLENRLMLVASTIKSIVQERDTAVKEGCRSRKAVATKDKKLGEVSALLVAARDEKSGLEEKLVLKVSRLEAELAKAKSQLCDARSEPAKVREEFHSKVQRQYEKITALEETITEKNDEIAEKDDNLNKCKVEGRKLKTSYGEKKKSCEALKKELDELKALHRSS